MENWRPISLVNVDTKIMTKAIASRIKSVLPDIIHPNQTGYVKDRFIGKTTQGEITCFRISETWRKHATPCFRYVYVLRKREKFKST